MNELQWARAIAAQIALNRQFGEYDPESGKAGCSRASDWDGAHAKCAIKFLVCCQWHRAVRIFSPGDRNRMFGGINGISFDHWAIYDHMEPTLCSPVAKVPGYLVEGYLGFMMPTTVDVIADSTRKEAAA